MIAELELGPDITTTSEEIDKSKKLAKQYSMMELHLNKEQELFINNKLSSKLWRMDNLYTIRDKNNVKAVMKLNNSQKKVLSKFRHKKKIILKSRQQGISTLFLAYYLDACIFKPGFQAGIQSYGLDESTKLQKRAELMWEELDQNIKDILGLKLVSNNSRGMTFSNGSVLKIGNFRGDTLQGLHVSELGKIAKRYPEKADELKKGAFQAVAVGNLITIESTAEGQTGLFYEMWERYTAKVARGKKLTALDFQPIFLSWMEDPDCQLFEDVDVEPHHQEYLDKLYEDIPNLQLTKPQINWLLAKLDELGDDFDQEYPATPDRAFAQSSEGMYFRHQYEKLIAEKRLGWFPHVDGEEVYVSWDLGMNDEMVLIFLQIVGGRPRIINCYHNTGQDIEFYAKIMHALRDKYGYLYGETIVPFDIKVKEMTSGMTRRQTMNKHGIRRIRVVKKISFMESIQIARVLINMVEIHEKTAEHVALSIQQYRKKYDKKIGAYLDSDVHDIHSNYMASFRYMAQGLGLTKLTNIKQESTSAVRIGRTMQAYQGSKSSKSNIAV